MAKDDKEMKRVSGEPSATGGRLSRIFAGIPDADDRAWALEHLAPPWWRRQRMIEARDAALRELGAFHLAASGRDTARRVYQLLSRYQGAARDRGPRPADPRRAALHDALALSGGRVPSVATIRRALAGIGSESLAPLRQGAVSTMARGAP